MHDVVRDVAISIASSNSHDFMAKAGTGLRGLQRSKNINASKRISLMLKNIRDFSGQLEYAKLLALLLMHDFSLVETSHNFLVGMKGLFGSST